MSKSNRIRILIVDDHLALRVGLTAMLAARPHLLVVAEADKTAGAIAACEKHHPDVVLMDLRIPGGGVEATIAIRQRWPATRVLIVTTYDGDEDIHRAIQAGASGYLLKGLTSSELIAGIEAIHRGEKVMPPNIATRHRERVLRKDLSSRELEVLRLIGQDKTYKDIGSLLGLSIKTVGAHRENIKSKLNLGSGRALHLVAKAYVLWESSGVDYLI